MGDIRSGGMSDRCSSQVCAADWTAVFALVIGVGRQGGPAACREPNGPVGG